MNTLTLKIGKKFTPVFDVEEYQKLLKKYNHTVTGYRMYKHDGAKKEYWEKLPKLILAKCPICDADHSDRLDLHTTVLISSSVDVRQLLFYRHPPYTGCKHLVRTALFINLNNNTPQRRLFVNSEVPYITDCMFPTDIPESYAVINAFPLCRIEGDKFVPTYTLFILAYYGEEPNKLFKLKEPDWEGLYRPVLYSVDEAWKNREKKIFDLKHWIERGRLFWLDEKNGEAILRNDADAFPYINIEGYVEKMIYEDGGVKVVGHNNTPRYYPTWKPEDWSKEKKPKRIEKLFSQYFFCSLF